MDSISVSFQVGSNEFAINTLKKLEKVDKHNNRKYKVSYRKELDLSLSKHNIILKGTDNLVNDVKELYKKEFDEFVEKYNQKQDREDRKIKNYFEKVCEDKQKNIVVEIILQLGDKEDWENILLEEKKKIAEVFKNGIGILNNKNLKVAHAIVHLDESTPHCHIIAIPITKNCERGLEKQVSLNKTLSKQSLAMLRGLLNKELLKKYNKVFNCNKTLKKGSEIPQHLGIVEYKL